MLTSNSFRKRCHTSSQPLTLTVLFIDTPGSHCGCLVQCLQYTPTNHWYHTIQGVLGLLCYNDDQLVTGKMLGEHTTNQKMVLQSAKQYGVRIIGEKYPFLQPSLNFQVTEVMLRVITHLRTKYKPSLKQTPVGTAAVYAEGTYMLFTWIIGLTRTW